MEKNKREIKFRFWDKIEKVMRYPKNSFPDLDYLYFEDIKRAEWGDNEFVSLQFTGLLDKNGKEIYCGDIVKGYFDTNEVEDYIWLSLTDEEKKNGWKLFKIDMDIVEFARQQLPDELEIVGNVMENPNLLSEKEE